MKTVTQLIEAYKSGEISMDDPLWIDNDTTFVYVGDDDEESIKVFEMHPVMLLEVLLDYVGIPSEGV